ncbi:MAG: acyl transferase [Bacteroidetes bacterium]|nr:MAG: acyl transferase [Bacteroidota bacterium]
MIHDLKERVFKANRDTFASIALEIFRFQYLNNALYKLYVESLKIDPNMISDISRLPFMPISFFKENSIKTTDFESEIIFESSGTTRSQPSRHFVKDLDIYRKSYKRGFELFYGEPVDWCIIGLLPSYIERGNSSLVWMVDQLIHSSKDARSGFYLDELDELHHVLQSLEAENRKTLLIGVTFALVDFAERFSLDLKNTIVMETGGMKGRRKEITRMELHEFLKRKLGLKTVHAEYGMTELLSQAYSKGEGIFNTPPWMKVLVSGDDDPFDINPAGEGVINVIDLANLYSCSFIATDDLGRIYSDGSFEVLGRRDASDIRGCSLLVI